jgi:hypothetical protein
MVMDQIGHMRGDTITLCVIALEERVGDLDRRGSAEWFFALALIELFCLTQIFALAILKRFHECAHFFYASGRKRGSK